MPSIPETTSSQSDNSLSHVDPESNQARMVDVSPKTQTLRTATAQAKVKVGEAILGQLAGNDIISKKGPVFQTAIIAGTMAAKRTSDLIPFCHPIGLEDCKLRIYVDQDRLVVIECSVRVSAKTGVEMEALTGASVAALTVYDMCKSMSHEIVILETRLLEKTGGKSDYHAS